MAANTISIFANSGIIMINANANFINTTSMNVLVTADPGGNICNIAFSANTTAIAQLVRIAGISSAVANSTNVSNIETYVTSAFNIPASTSVAGDTFRITVCGARLEGEQSNYTFNVRYGTAGTVVDPVLVTLTNKTQVGDGKSGIYEQFMVTIRSTGATGVAIASAQNHLGGIPVIGNPIVINTTQSNYLGLSFTTSNKYANIIFTTATVEQVQ